MGDPFERRKAARDKWNKKAYKEIKLRVHRGSDLEDRLGAYMSEGGSVNFLLAELLSGHFGVANPYKERHIRHVTRLFP